jgi:hypothetical protein
MRHLNRLLLIGFTAMTAVLTGCATIPSGRTGVEWTLTRGTENRTLEEGFHLVSPFSRIYQSICASSSGTSTSTCWPTTAWKSS